MSLSAVRFARLEFDFSVKRIDIHLIVFHIFFSLCIVIEYLFRIIYFMCLCACVVVDFLCFALCAVIVIQAHFGWNKKHINNARIFYFLNLSLLRGIAFM